MLSGVVEKSYSCFTIFGCIKKRFVCILFKKKKSACCSRKKEKKKWALSPSTCKSSETITHHPLLLNLWPTLCPSVWPKRTQMEAHSVLAAPHKCAEMLSSSRATQRAAPSTVGSMLSYSSTETTLQLLPQGSRLQAHGNLSLHPFPLIGLLLLELFCYDLPPPCVSQAAEDVILRCVCCSWCCESGRWQTPPITRLFHNTRVAPYHCRRDEEPPNNGLEGGAALVFSLVTQTQHEPEVDCGQTLLLHGLVGFVLCFGFFTHSVLFEFIMCWVYLLWSQPHTFCRLN